MNIRIITKRLMRFVRKSILRIRGMQIGNGTIIDAGCFWGTPGRVVIGSGSYVNRRCYFDVTGHINIGNNVEIGHGATFVTARHQIGQQLRRSGPVEPKSITIEDGAWIGANSTLLPGITIGRGSIVGAGAVVTESVKPNTIVGGVPAKLIRRLEQQFETHSRSAEPDHASVPDKILA